MLALFRWTLHVRRERIIRQPCEGRPQSGAKHFRIRCRPVQVSYEFLLQSVARPLSIAPVLWSIVGT
jgi:hypothetical protein